MRITPLSTQDHQIIEQAARMLVEQFDEPRGWPTLQLALEEVPQVIEEGFAFGILDGERLAGWIGGLPEYDGRVWELHPMVVHREYRGKGLGRELVAAFEAEATRRGGLTATLGTDDDSLMTSLSSVDLYTNLPEHLANIRDLGRNHPFGFYQKLGYVVTGVVPDANGPGKPDIFMSKRLIRV